MKKLIILLFTLISGLYALLFMSLSLAMASGVNFRHINASPACVLSLFILGVMAAICFAIGLNNYQES